MLISSLIIPILGVWLQVWKSRSFRKSSFKEWKNFLAYYSLRPKLVFYTYHDTKF